MRGTVHLDRTLADQIRAAWAKVEPPVAADFDPHDLRDAAAATRVRGDWLGRDWRTVDAAFLADRTDWPYMRPRALHYFLPAFLLAALEPDAHRSHADVIMILGPSADRVAAGQRDDRLEERVALLDPFQGRCAAATLAHLVDRADASPFVRWSAAVAVEHVWGPSDVARSFLAELRWWERPAPPDRERAALIDEIDRAFADTPYPGDGALRGSNVGDEPYQVELGFRGVDWQRASPMLLNVHDAALAFLSHAGFRYFLPAFLVADLLALLRAADPLYYLTHGLERPDAAERFEGFTGEERAAVAAYLRWREADPYEQDQIDRALEEFWEAPD
jgi:hypothetical protein